MATQKTWDKAQTLVEVQEDLTHVHWWDGVREVARVIVCTKWFDNFILLAIMANMVCLSLYRPTEPDDSKHNSGLNEAEFIFTIIFTVEFLLKMMAIGPRKYFDDGFNHLDFLIVFFG
eukprot:3951842-Pyramimonas_sp.AAC.1